MRTDDGINTAVVPAGLAVHWSGSVTAVDTGSPRVTVPMIGVPPRTEFVDKLNPVSEFCPQVYTSSVLVTLTPICVVTVMCAESPFVPGGDVAVMEVSEFTVKVGEGTAPKSTSVVPVKCEPVIVTGVPPSVTPNWGLMPVTTGVVVAVLVVVVAAVEGAVVVVLWHAAPAAAAIRNT